MSETNKLLYKDEIKAIMIGLPEKVNEIPGPTYVIGASIGLKIWKVPKVHVNRKHLEGFLLDWVLVINVVLDCLLGSVVRCGCEFIVFSSISGG